jgi:uncharacterized protein
MLTKDQKFTGFELKAASDGTFEGYGSVFHEVDSYQEATEPGSFAKSIGSGRMPKMLWQHDQTRPIGTFSAVAEDSKGLHVRGKLLLSVPDGQHAKEHIDAGTVDGLSIGYNVKADRYDQKTGVRHLTEIDLHEISVVTFPAGPSARITSLKSIALEDLEDALRAGELPRLSNRDAKRFISAWRRMNAEEPQDDLPNPDELAAFFAACKS